jgi:hypothetical protein
MIDHQFLHNRLDILRRVGAWASGKASALVGFSSGGGFALRLAASPRQCLFHCYPLPLPFLVQDAPTAREGSKCR